MEAISYKLGHSKGSLDLLLHLTEKSKINIYDIPIVEITAQYLDYVYRMKREDLSIVNEFLMIAATLLDIKAKVPFPKEMDEEEEEIDPRAELAMRLLEYRKYRLVTDELADQEDGVLKHLYEPSTLPPEAAKYEPTVDLGKLLDGSTLAEPRRVFGQVMKCKEDKVDPIRSDFEAIYRESVSLEQKVGSALSYARRKHRFSFRGLLEEQPDKLEMVATFLTALELVKMGKIHLSQEETFGDMDIEMLEQEDGEGELDLAQLGDFEG